MKDDPDIIRWSQLKSFAINVLGWMLVYGIIGWLGDIGSQHSTLNRLLVLFGISVFMAFVIRRD